MKYYTVRLSPEAQADLIRIHDRIVMQSGSTVPADRYIDRIDGFLSSLNLFPERGTVRSEVRSGLRIIGFEHSASVAFIVEDADVVVLRVLSKGQNFGETAEEIASVSPEKGL